MHQCDCIDAVVVVKFICLLVNSVSSSTTFFSPFVHGMYELFSNEYLTNIFIGEVHFSFVPCRPASSASATNPRAEGALLLCDARNCGCLKITLACIVFANVVTM